MRDGAGGAQGVEVGFEVVEVEGRARDAAGHVFEDEQHDWARNQGKAACEEASGGAEVEADEFVFVAGEGVRGTEEDQAAQEGVVGGCEPESDGSAVGVAEEDGLV